MTLTCETRKSALEKQPTGDLPRVEKSQQGYNKNPGVPRPGCLPPTTRMETLAKVFRVNLPANVKKRPFLDTDGILSPDPDFSALPNRHHLIELTSANQVQANSQVFSARAQRVLASKGPVERLPRLSQSFIKRFNHLSLTLHFLRKSLRQRPFSPNLFLN